jgi:hypothetical protein
LSYCPRSSLPARVLAWLADRLAHLHPARPPGQGGTPPLSLEVRLDAVAAVILDGLSYRRASRAVGISKTEVGDSLDLLLGPLAALGYCQPDGTFITSLDELRQWLGEMTTAGEAVCLDGLATRVQRPRGWANQKVLDDAKRHAHTAQGLAISTIHGDLLPRLCKAHDDCLCRGVSPLATRTAVRAAAGVIEGVADASADPTAARATRLGARGAASSGSPRPTTSAN